MADLDPQTDEAPPIRIEGLTFQYRTGEFELRVPALEVAPGESIAVIGPSGSGKTTFLHLVAGIALPMTGRIRVGEVEVSALSDAARRAFRITRMGLVFQEFELLDYLSVLDNVLLPYRIGPTLTLDGEVRDRAARIAGEVGLSDKLRRSVRRLSQGERQRVAVCRALVTRPGLLLADEPTGNLDPGNKDRVLEILFEQAEKTGATLLTVTHDHGLLDRFDRVVDAANWESASGGTA
jgi:putative ABC transport system ATP-binding protein